MVLTRTETGPGWKWECEDYDKEMTKEGDRLQILSTGPEVLAAFFNMVFIFACFND